ncbi:MAG: hypothetical protein CL607_02000 [Anaerolineaceae bacterium]|nr:hypothetical protein [Anaerolineaceae bacterium]
MENREYLLKSWECLGLIRYKDVWSLHYAIPEMWILDFSQYDSQYDPAKDPNQWRRGLITIGSNNVDSYIASLVKIELDEAYRLSQTTEGNEGIVLDEYYPPLQFLIDFNKKLFINGWTEIIPPLHLYIPSGWQGLQDSPYKYVPPHILDKLHWDSKT